MPRKNTGSATLVGQDDVAQFLSLGSVVALDTPATKNHRLIVTAIRQHEDGPLRPMLDYALEGDPGSLRVRLRLISGEDGKVRSRTLTLYDSLPYSEGLHAVVSNELATLTIHDDIGAANSAGDIFWRLYDVKESHIHSVNIQSSKGVSNTTIEYWDYSRMTDIDGIETEEFVVVEMNAFDRAFEIWRGIEVTRSQINPHPSSPPRTTPSARRR